MVWLFELSNPSRDRALLKLSIEVFLGLAGAGFFLALFLFIDLTGSLLVFCNSIEGLIFNFLCELSFSETENLLISLIALDIMHGRQLLPDEAPSRLQPHESQRRLIISKLVMGFDFLIFWFVGCRQKQKFSWWFVYKFDQDNGGKG